MRSRTGFSGTPLRRKSFSNEKKGTRLERPVVTRELFFGLPPHLCLPPPWAALPALETPSGVKESRTRAAGAFPSPPMSSRAVDEGTCAGSGHADDAQRACSCCTRGAQLGCSAERTATCPTPASSNPPSARTSASTTPSDLPSFPTRTRSISSGSGRSLLAAALRRR